MNPQTLTRRIVAPLLALVILALTACEDVEDRIQNALDSVTGEGAAAVGDDIDLRVLGFLGQQQLPGATVAVTRGGRLVWSKGYGLANREDETPMQPWHRSRIGSVSKVLTTVGALQLVEKGTFALGSRIYGNPGPVPVESPDTLRESWPGPRHEWPKTTSVLKDPEQYWHAMLDGALDRHSVHYSKPMNEIRDRASELTIRHLLSHTSGLLRSGHGKQVAAYHGIDTSQLTYPMVHKAVLKGVITEPEHSEELACYQGGELYVPKDDPDYTGTTHALPPFGSAPGEARCYSNHGFGLLGHILEEASGASSYASLIGKRVLEPLGLTDVVPNNTAIDDGRDAWPHGDELDPDNPSKFVATGGWSASAQDLTRVMCSLDAGSNHLRVLKPETVRTMQSIHFPAADGKQPLGWDSRSGTELYKNGSTGGGFSVIIKNLPGAFSEAPGEEINVAVAVNASAPDGAMGTLNELVRDIAATIAAADIPADYDLFDPEHACVTIPEEQPTLTITQPGDSARFALGEEIHFEAEARDGTGYPLPITWDMPGLGVTTTQPGTLTGTHSVFHDGMPKGKHTVTATTVDVAGQTAQQKLTVEITYDAPEVAIVSHDDGETVWAGEPLKLTGQSTSGLFALAGDQVRWQVHRNGQEVASGLGHELTVPANTVTPGEYAVTFSGSDGIEQADVAIAVTAENKPAGLPVVRIDKPLAGSEHVGGKVDVDFAATAADADDNAIPGTSLRWTATSEETGEIVLCEGGDVPGATPSGGDGGGFTVKQDCSSFTAALEGHHYAANTYYVVTAQVWDAEGNTDKDAVTVKVRIPPVG